jgi:hypothetical protein
MNHAAMLASDDGVGKSRPFDSMAKELRGELVAMAVYGE